MPERPAGMSIAISRERGSGGSYVGQRVAQRLGLCYVDRELLRDAAEYFQVHDPARVEREEIESSWWARLGKACSLGGPDGVYVPPSSAVVYEGELFEAENRLLHDIADHHVAVIVGRGAAQILRGRTNVLTAFVHAPEQWRVNRIQQVYNIAERRVAVRMVQDSDRDRARFIRTLAGIEWTDARGYDLAFDSAAVGLDPAVDLIVQAAAARLATPVSSGPAHTG